MNKHEKNQHNKLKIMSNCQQLTQIGYEKPLIPQLSEVS